jgi:NADH:ubiquinone oxidoreductase subunit B-like Fe-S oxidoreductase
VRARCDEEAPIESIELPQPVKFIPNWGRKYSLRIMNLGLACRAIELNAT